MPWDRDFLKSLDYVYEPAVPGDEEPYGRYFPDYHIIRAFGGSDMSKNVGTILWHHETGAVDVAVLPEAQHHGLAKKLLNDARTISKDTEGVVKPWLVPNVGTEAGKAWGYDLVRKIEAKKQVANG